VPRAILAFPAALLVAALVLAASCQDFPPVVLCNGAIPSGGCPVGRGGTCADLTCNALWDCVGGQWVHVQTCPMPDGGTGGGGDGGPGGDAGEGEGGHCTPVHIDTTGQTSGCTPDLAFPDCPVEAAEGCAETACLTGCSDFFLCRQDGTNADWIDVAYCTDSGELVVTQ
jgi:hypothetical protein